MAKTESMGGISVESVFGDGSCQNIPAKFERTFLIS